jgi:hypothetical protein
VGQIPKERAAISFRRSGCRGLSTSSTGWASQHGDRLLDAAREAGAVWLGAIAWPIQQRAPVMTGDAAIEENGQPGIGLQP